MTKLEYYEIIRAIETVEENEKIYCNEYIKLNPGDKNRRERDRDLILSGLLRARYRIEKIFKDVLTEV